ncbi:hypothetical protein DFH06DRAFT_1319055 [Mycena polygramma]|nr:hypothetical protein DFH06DRAFT_1319055 [Mycena polygramma]
MPPRRPKAEEDGEDNTKPTRRKRARGEEDIESGPSASSQRTAERPPKPKRQRARGEADGEDAPPLRVPVATGQAAPRATTTDHVETGADSTANQTEPKEFFGPWEPKQRTRPQGASVAINAARPYFRAAQRRILASFAHKDMGRPCRRCNAPAGETIYRCRECFKGPLCCAKCIVETHHYTPFHRIEEWIGTHFVPASLSEKGLIIYTCPKSDGTRCKDVNETSVQQREMVLGDDNGFHTIRIEYCSCTAGIGEKVADHWDQLMGVQLFPASFDLPKTVFTYTLMKRFHIHCLTSKKSPYDFVKALYKLTNNAFSHSVKDRYREFQFAYRLWRDFALERRTGNAHNISPLVPNRRAGSRTVRCPCCPEVGFNMTAEQMDATPDSEKHKVTLYLSGDGNFKMQRKNKRDDPDDVALNAGQGYFVETEEYKRYTGMVKPSEELSTCSHLRAARMQNIGKFKNAVISGVVAIQCARHGFYLPQGMVDLKKGEAFALTDYALTHSLGEAARLRWIMFTYDIWCQYSINLPTRWTDHFPSMVWMLDRIRGAIPKMHIHGHVELCQLLWNLNWLAYSAFTVGEMIETGWAEHNLTAGSTKEMNDGNRHDSVDDTSGSWNWDKLVGIAKALQRLFRVAKAELRTRSANFDALTATHPPELIAKWEKVDVTQKIVGKGKEKELSSAFKAKFKKGPPTHAAAYAKLLQEEVDAMAAAAAAEEVHARTVATGTQDAGPSTPTAAASASLNKKSGDSTLITSALLVERDQHHVRRMIIQHAAEDLVDAGRRRLHKSITDIRSRLVARAPALESHISDVDPEKPEKEKLFLPSYFTAQTRNELNVQALAQVEYELRQGQAFDALNDVRTAIRTLNWNLQLKKEGIHGVGPNTKAQNFLKTLSNDIQLAADVYRRARAALVMLGMAEDDATLRPLLKNDLFGKSGKLVAMGDSKKHDSWVWTTGRAADMSESDEKEWEAELAKVKWYRDRALRDRAVEEVELLHCEFERAIVSFAKNGSIWDTLASGAEEAGEKAYAYKQAAMYKKMGVECQNAYDATPGLVEKDRVAAEAKERKEREEAERQAAEYQSRTGTTDEFSAYYETIEI